MNRRIRLTAIATLALGSLALMPAAANAAVDVSPTSLAFGNQQVGTTSPAKTSVLTVSCADEGPLGFCLTPEIFTPFVSITGPFAQTNNCPTPFMVGLDDDQSCDINVTFTPPAVGAFNGTVNTGPGGPTIALTGTGVVATPAPQQTPAAGGVAGQKAKKCKKGKKKRSAAAAKKCKKKRK